jgi:hypothetical protein
MRLACFALLFLLTIVNVTGQVQIPAKIRHTADSINFKFLGPSTSKSQYACGQIYTKSAKTFTDCDGSNADPKQSKNVPDRKVVFYCMYYMLTFTSNSHYVYKINLNPKAVLIDDVELPPCAEGRACDIKIDSVRAIELAIASGLNPTHGIINDGLALDYATMKFGWQIKNRSEKNADRGVSIWIDAYSGERLREKDKPWMFVKFN